MEKAQEEKGRKRAQWRTEEGRCIVKREARVPHLIAIQSPVLSVLWPEKSVSSTPEQLIDFLSPSLPPSFFSKVFLRRRL